MYRYLQEEGGFDVTGIYFSDFSLRGAFDPGFGREVKWDIDLLDGYEAKFMGKAARQRELSGFFSMVAPEVWPAIHRGDFDAVVVNGHYVAGFHIALAAARASGTPVFARGDTNGFRRRVGWRAAVRRKILSRFYRMFDGVLSIGTANDLHYRAMGVPNERIFRMPFVVDNDRFSVAANTTPKLQHNLRSEFDLDPDLPVICFAGKLSPHKRPHDLLEAYARLISSGIQAQLAIVGSGELEGMLQEEATNIEGAHVHFLGFVNQSQLPNLFAASDLFVLPSSFEAWGLVVNEAMCAGLPIICSRECGCSHDLVKDGLNGHVFNAGDVDALFKALSNVLGKDDLRSSYSSESKAIIANWSFRECADGLREAITATIRTTEG
ncbi:glycosyltransferase family 4 protein [Aestuariicoccus sp. MJ-SS9]|uniref:glycosyltransferase family 4 protein n=1 Tax=Aestuariicoccus sp. MJ-SS9 TaxID=3079855 RepID=UPI00290E0144|nr:glycosyltransferase family 4 protein [Aestuariicoccus sp. MJ-SS9]MDU8913524.1 glycosyltransferase family 4 protein [Aestuariicoccus sp. MJ-SS9]